MFCYCYKRFAQFSVPPNKANGFYLFTDSLHSIFITFFLLLFFPLFAIFIKMRIEWLVTAIISLHKLAYETDC